MTPRRLFSISAGLEGGAGLALLLVPAPVIKLVFGFSGLDVGVASARLAGAALLSLGAACWLARHDGGSAGSRALASGLLVYNAAVVILVLSTMLGSLTTPLWAIAVLHSAMALWCLSLLRVGR